jgi:UDPglucose--hexose-1-phosphate uridylyltransferase
VAKIEFRSLVQSSTYLDPFKDFEPSQGTMEVRWDPLTGLTSRVVHFSVRRIGRYDIDALRSANPVGKCPFCDENKSSMSARLDSSVFGCYYMQKGDVTLIPNLISFDKYSLVAIMSREHFLDINSLAERQSIRRGIEMLIEGFKCIRENDSAARFFSINCNYMPMSGGSLIHPHIQGIAGEWPTNYHRMMLEKSAEFFSATGGTTFWDALMTEEKATGTRFIGEIGGTFWYTPFAPKGNTDVAFILSKPSLFLVDEGEWTNFSFGLNKTLKYLDKENVAGFNLSIFSGNDEDGHFRVNGRLVARRFLPPTNAADVNYFEKIHLETACLLAPETVASQMREIW